MILRITVIDRSSGRIVGTVAAPEGFYFGEGFGEWRNAVFGKLLQEVIEQSDQAGRMVCMASRDFSVEVISTER